MENGAIEKKIPVTDFVFVPSSKNLNCVDGRSPQEGDGNYAQLLGGLIGPVALKYFLTDNNEGFIDLIEPVKDILHNQGFTGQVHTDMCSSVDCGCGFAANLKTIAETLVRNQEKYFNAIKSLGLDLHDKKLWETIVKKVYQREGNIPEGMEMIEGAVSAGVEKTTLTGDHDEKLAIVNTVPDTTLLKGEQGQQQAFSLDLWMIDKIAPSMQLDPALAKMLMLGLYLATEKVLVQDKGKIGLAVELRRS